MDLGKNSEIELARNLILHTHNNLFLTGRAGTGKTTFLHSLCQELRKPYLIVAPTGIAALNAQGTTLHSQFNLPLDPYIPALDYTDNNPLLKRISQKEKVAIIKQVELIIIDEVSMVRADTLQALSDRLCEIRKTNVPFAGVQLLLIGDLYQLPPVTTEAWTMMEQYYRTPFFFSSPAFKKSPFYFLELQKIYRQNDVKFIELLETIRTGKGALAAALKQLNERVVTESSEQGLQEGQIILTALRKQSADYNERCLHALSTKEYHYAASIDGHYNEKDAPTDLDLVLKVGAQVMFVRNESEEKTYVNGELGRVSQLSDTEIQVTKYSGGMPVTVAKVKWEKYDYRLDPTTRAIKKTVVGTFVQYPLRLAWAITIHKSQGLTFDQVRIDAQRIFAAGQLYVALSRCRTLEGIELTAPIPQNAIRVSDKIDAFIEYCHTRLKNPKELLQDLERSNNVREVLDTLNAISPSHEREKLTGQALKQAICLYAEQKLAVSQLLDWYEVSVREFTESVLSLLLEEKFRLQDVIDEKTFSYLRESFSRTPKMKITDRIQELYGKAKSYEVRWFQVWEEQQHGLFRLE